MNKLIILNFYIFNTHHNICNLKDERDIFYDKT